MRKIVNLILLMLSALPFAFFKMETIGYQNVGIDFRDGKIVQIEGPYTTGGAVRVTWGQIHYFFLYNKETGYTIGYGDPISIYLDCIEFFESGKESHFRGKSEKSFIFIEEQPDLQIKTLKLEPLVNHVETKEGILNEETMVQGESAETSLKEKTMIQIGPKEEPRYFKGMMNGSRLFYDNSHINQPYDLILNEDFKRERAVTLSEEFTIESNVLISNKGEGVEISKKDYPARDFEQALTHYLEHSKDDEYTLIAKSIDDIAKGRTTNDTPYDLGRECRNLLIKDSQLELLKGSNILSVFGVFKNKEGESVIWGSAEDKKSKEPFYWMTRLKGKVSDLINFN